MENLVGRKVKCVESYDGVTEGKEYTITNVDNSGFYIIEDDGRKQKWDTSHLDSATHFELLIDEPQFKQGDKVLWRGGKSKDKTGIFICEYENYFIVKHIGNDYDLENGKLRYATNIKPYEDEIKVGDWVHNSDGHVLKCKYLGLNNNPNWIKITNQDLIDKLNKL